MRRVLEFLIDSQKLAATLDEGHLNAGLLIVSGGNEIRIGAHRGMARLAQAVAAEGFPVFRFDRRGIGDSEGENGGFYSSAPDIAGALATFRDLNPHLTRILAFGNCDAATALVLHQPDVDALILANPWIVEQFDALPPPAAIKARYAQRFRDPTAWLALLTGKLSLLSAARGLHRIALGNSQDKNLAESVAMQLAASNIAATIIIADRDNTGIAFAAAWQSLMFAAVRSRNDIEFLTLASSSHSFAADGDFEFLLDQLFAALRQ